LDEHPSAAPSFPPPSAPVDSANNVTDEDFLFHLYRGSELLQENRVHDAKEELEQALTMQPLDPKGQDLLGTVYFRLGLYPRAIQIYEDLARQFARDVSVKINLALCYLKTGQPDRAHAVLADAVRLNPDHKRAWAYLGLALEKLGDIEQAQVAFDRGGHPTMAKRLTDALRRSKAPLAPDPSLPGVRDVAETAFLELDAGDLRFALAEPDAQGPGESPWHALEPGAPLTENAVSTSSRAPRWRGLDAPTSFFAVLADRPTALDEAGLLLVRTSVVPARAFAGRVDALRAVSGAIAMRELHRRTRNTETKEVLGGVGSPLVGIEGDARLLFGPRAGHKLALLAVEAGLAFIRENVLFGFDLALTYENGRVLSEPWVDASRPSGEAMSLVQLRGDGTVVLEVTGSLGSVASFAGRHLVVRRQWVVGWLGRLVTRMLPSSEAPGTQADMLSFSGDGVVLLCSG
jgi:hypothetical protein